MGVFSAVLFLPAAQEGGWEGGHRDNGCSRSQSPESRGLTLHTPPRSGKTGDHVPLRQQFQSAGSVMRPRGAGSLSPEGAFRIIMGHFANGQQPGGCARPVLLGCPSHLAQGHLPTGVLLGPEEICLPGAFGRRWSRACGERDLQLPQTHFFRRPDSERTRPLPTHQGLLLSVRQVTSHMLTCGLICRE